MRKIMFQTDYNHDYLIFSVDHNESFTTSIESIQATYLAFNIACWNINT